MGNLINDNNIPLITATNFSVVDVDGKKEITWGDGKILDNSDLYPEYLLGECDTCDNDKNNTLKSIFDFSYNSVLVGGLGLGLIPQYLHTQGKSVDVVEIDSELIDYVDFIDSSINVIEGDIYTYNTSNKYDLIIVDLWWEESEITDEMKSNILSNWSDNINPGGKIILPVGGTVLN